MLEGPREPYGRDGYHTNRWRVEAFIYKSRTDIVQRYQRHDSNYTLLTDSAPDIVRAW
jgi:hypothetical protein